MTRSEFLRLVGYTRERYDARKLRGSLPQIGDGVFDPLLALITIAGDLLASRLKMDIERAMTFGVRADRQLRARLPQIASLARNEVGEDVFLAGIVVRSDTSERWEFAVGTAEELLISGYHGRTGLVALVSLGWAGTTLRENARAFDIDAPPFWSAPNLPPKRVRKSRKAGAS